MADDKPYRVDVFYKLNPGITSSGARIPGNYEYVKMHRFETPQDAAEFRAAALRAPPVPADAFDVEIDELRGPGLAEEPTPVHNAEWLAKAQAALGQRLKREI